MKKKMKTKKVRVTRTGRRLVVTFVIGISICLGILLSSCNVTRTVTTTSQYFQHGDTTCTIVTKTIESYDASKKQ